MILWLIGISGAGKTTIGRRLEAYLNEKGVRNYLLDGDEVRDLFDRDLGYSDADREANINRILLGAYLMDRTDTFGIIIGRDHAGVGGGTTDPMMPMRWPKN